MPDDYKNEEEWHARKRCGETPFQNDFLEQSIKGASYISNTDKLGAIYIFIIALMLIILTILVAYSWSKLNCFKNANWLIRGVETVIIKK